jgi:SAM-dependent methyltransferase
MKRASLSHRTSRQRAADVYGWWWWRSPNRPHVIDRTFIDMLDEIPAGSRGLDLGSRSRVRPDALTVDVVDEPGVDVVADGHSLPFPDGSFDYVWCNAVLEHVKNPFRVAAEIERVVCPGGLVFVQVPFLENVHGWPDDYFRYTPNGLRQLFPSLDELAAGVSAGPSQVVPDVLQYYASGFADIQEGSLLLNLYTVAIGTLLLPLRYLDRALRHRPSYWKWSRAYYMVAQKPPSGLPAERGGRAVFLTPRGVGEGFEEIMRLRTREMVEALRRAGIDVWAVDAEGPAPPGLEAFDPDFLVAPNLNYVLQGALQDDSLVNRIDRPPVMLWDDPLGALSLWLIIRRGGTLGWLNEPGDAGDPLESFRSMMAAPGARHFSWDTGHIEAAVELGLAPSDAIEWYPIATFRPFLEQGRRGPVEPRVDVAFAGNVYESALGRSNFTGHPFYGPLAEAIRARKLADLSASGWELLRSEVARLSVGDRTEYGLEPTRAEYWDFYLYVVWLVLTTAVRVELLTKVERPVHMFGVFADPDSQELLRRHPNLVYAGHVSHFDELPRTFAETKVNVCISNGLIYSGVPSKLIDCLASGGFALVDPKDDLVRLFGPEIDAIVFRDADELNAKIEYYLGRPGERREIVETLRKTIEERCTLDRLFARVVAVAPRR